MKNWIKEILLSERGSVTSVLFIHLVVSVLVIFLYLWIVQNVEDRLIHKHYGEESVVEIERRDKEIFVLLTDKDTVKVMVDRKKEEVFELSMCVLSETKPLKIESEMSQNDCPNNDKEVQTVAINQHNEMKRKDEWCCR